MLNAESLVPLVTLLHTLLLNHFCVYLDQGKLGHMLQFTIWVNINDTSDSKSHKSL